MAGVLVEGWKRRIPVGELPDLLRRSTSTRRLRCACVESNVDQMTAYTNELEEQFGLEPVPIYISPVPLARPQRSVEFYGVQDRLREVDLVVTTVYHWRLVRAAAEAVGTPTVTLSVNPETVDTMRRRLRDTFVTVVAVDPVFGDRIRAMYEDELTDPDRIRVVLADDAQAAAAIPPGEPVLLTRAARSRLGDGFPNPLVVPHSPTFSARTARELLEVMIRLNVGAGLRTSADAAPLEPEAPAA
jgi:hypothetical protein